MLKPRQVEHPNRPVDATVAKLLHPGHDILHKGVCRDDDTAGFGSHRLKANYLVTGVDFQVDSSGNLVAFQVHLVNEFSYEPVHPTMAEMLHYHRLEDCPSLKRKPKGKTNYAKPKPESRIFIL